MLGMLVPTALTDKHVVSVERQLIVWELVALDEQRRAETGSKREAYRRIGIRVVDRPEAPVKVRTEGRIPGFEEASVKAEVPDRFEPTAHVERINRLAEQRLRLRRSKRCASPRTRSDEFELLETRIPADCKLRRFK